VVAVSSDCSRWRWVTTSGGAAVFFSSCPRRGTSLWFFPFLFCLCSPFLPPLFSLSPCLCVCLSLSSSPFPGAAGGEAGTDFCFFLFSSASLRSFSLLCSLFLFFPVLSFFVFFLLHLLCKQIFTLSHIRSPCSFFFFLPFLCFPFLFSLPFLFLSSLSSASLRPPPVYLSPPLVSFFFSAFIAQNCMRFFSFILKTLGTISAVVKVGGVQRDCSCETFPITEAICCIC